MCCLSAACVVVVYSGVLAGCGFFCCWRGGRGVYVTSAGFVLFGRAENVLFYFFLFAFSSVMAVGRGGIAAAPAAPQNISKDDEVLKFAVQKKESPRVGPLFLI